MTPPPHQEEGEGREKQQKIVTSITDLLPSGEENSCIRMIVWSAPNYACANPPHTSS